MIISKQHYRELIEEINYYKNLYKKWQGAANEMCQKAIKKCKELNKRNIPMKTIEKKLPHLDESEREHYCPNCKKFLGFKFNHRKKFCDNCGQALKYEEETK